ncbi:Piwi domain-containing protein [Panaeolus papilionaceus]|nr:Piwi domain-containing protein [Panaeolus papilionaceus]
MSTTVNVETNSFVLSRLPSRAYHQYQIDFKSRKPLKRHQQIQYFHYLQNVVKPDIFKPRIVYDGASIGYCAARLDFNGSPSGSFTVMLGSPRLVEEGRGVTIVIGLAAADPIDPRSQGEMTPRAQVAINLIQNIVRQWPNMTYTNNGRAYFPGSAVKKEIGGGLELRRGIFQSVRPSSLQSLVLQIDSCTAALYMQGALISVCMNFLGGNTRDVKILDLAEGTSNFQRLERFLKKVKVTYTAPDRSPKKTKIVHGLVARAGHFTFMKDDREYTVDQHYRSAYGSPVRYPNIIGVRFTPKDAERPVVVPLEFCEVEGGQLYKKKIPDQLVSEVVRFSTQKPQQKQGHLRDAIRLYTTSEFVDENDIKIEGRPVTVVAKQLQTPAIVYGGMNRVRAEKGAWNVLHKKFQTPATMEHWGVINFQADRMRQDALRQRIRELLSCCKNLGMQIKDDPVFAVAGNAQNPRPAINDVMNALRHNYPSGPPPHLVVFVILPDNSAQLKQTIKQWGDIEHGFMTQCMRSEKIKGQGNLSQYFNNVALKVNARLGGVNSVVESPALREALKGTGNELTIVMGADASHPGPGVQKPTTTCLVFSRDENATKYTALMGIQHPRTEMIEELEKFVYSAIEIVGNENRRGPTRIIFFRDGVSEGEYDKVRRVELAAIQSAIDRLWTKLGLKESVAPKPKITFIVVGKRHHAVFFPQIPNGPGADSKGNCHPGTVVDQGVTQPTEHEFYLQSHSAIQGTVRSAHYVVLRDDIFNFNLPKLEEVAFALCHVYAKATRSVSIPAPVYYADLVCARGGIHINPQSNLMFNDSGSTTSGSDDSINMDAWRDAFASKTHRRLRDGMYFL